MKSNPIVKPIKPIAPPVLRSTFAPAPPESFARRFWRNTRFALVIAFFILLWAASSLFIAPVVQWSLNQASNYIERTAALSQVAWLLDVKMNVPCESFEAMPPGCGTDEEVGETRYGPGSVLYLWGKLPELKGLTFKQRTDGAVPDTVTEGAFYTVQKSFGALPIGDAAETLARNEMATYGAYEQRELAPDVTAYQATQGSSTRPENFYAVYTRADGKKVAAACFGDTCKVLQAPWRGDLAYGFTVNKRKARELPAIDAAVQDRLNGYVLTE